MNDKPRRFDGLRAVARQYRALRRATHGNPTARRRLHVITALLALLALTLVALGASVFLAVGLDDEDLQRPQQVDTIHVEDED